MCYNIYHDKLSKLSKRVCQIVNPYFIIRIDCVFMVSHSYSVIPCIVPNSHILIYPPPY